MNTDALMRDAIAAIPVNPDTFQTLIDSVGSLAEDGRLTV